MGYIYSQRIIINKRITTKITMTKPQKLTEAEKKKHFELMDPVKVFLRDLSGDIKQELNSLIWMLETDCFLEYPYGEKIGGDDETFCNTRHPNR